MAKPWHPIIIVDGCGEFIRRRYVGVVHDVVDCFDDVSGLVALGKCGKIINCTK
jgi:hypothetical protein